MDMFSYIYKYIKNPDMFTKFYGLKTFRPNQSVIFFKQNGGTAVDAVEKAIRVFEKHYHFNAGRGSCLNVSGDVECDAMIMDGNNVKTGKCYVMFMVNVVRQSETQV